MQTSEIASGDVVALIDTSLGMIKIKLFPELTPKTFDNFVTLSQKSYYNGIIFHRVIPNFMIQGGDPTGTGMGGESAFGEEFEDEFCSDLTHLRGALSMANAGPGTNGSQFFIVQAPQTNYLNGHHSVFGQVYHGMEVVDNIASQKKDRNDKPIYDVVINEIQIKTFKDGEYLEYKI